MKKNILAVDDERVILDLLVDCANLCNYNCYTAPDGLEALSILEKENIDLVVADIVMPNMNGFELLEAVRKKWPKLPIVLMTGFSGKLAEALAMNQKADGVISKPFDLPELKKIFAQFLNTEKPAN